MERRDFLKNMSLLLASTQFPACVFSDKKNFDFTVNTFEKELTMEGMQSFWAMLMTGYKNVLTPEQSWGVIDPSYKQWILTPKEIKGDPELVTRTMFGLGAWFSKKNRPSTITFRDEEINLKELLQNGIKNGTNPESPGYWNGSFTGKNPGGTQLAVEAPAVGLAYVLSKANGKIEFSEQEKEHLNNWLQIYSQQTRSNNWSLFYALTQTVCKKQEWDYDADLLKTNLDTGIGCYEGGGWFSDGKGERHFDDYNNWVFATFLMYWAMIDGDSYPELKAKIPGVIKELCAIQPYFYGGDGSHPENGRSITYKFARLSSLIMAYKMGYTDLPAGLIKRMLRLHILHYVKNGAIDTQSGIVLQGLSKDGTLDMREVYNYTGSTYWFMQTLAALWMLDDNDAFWTAKEELLPVEKADFAKHMAIPGWLVVGNKQSQSTIVYNAGVDHAKGWQEPSYAAKYKKNAYHSQLGCLAGNNKFVPCDNMPVLHYNDKQYYPVIESFDIQEGSISVLRVKQTFKADDIKGDVSVSTILFVKGEDMIRLSKFECDKKIKGAKIHIGGYPLGLNTTDTVTIKQDTNIVSATANGYQTILASLESKAFTLNADKRGYLGDEGKHTKYSSFYLPYFEGELKPSPALLAVAIRGSNVNVDTTKWMQDIELKNYGPEKAELNWKGTELQAQFI
uniref:DUF2264 domain-containing protein n=1 Tax=uncultured Draconibacterium sp. TaxID=1573823 RepID=UPI003216ACA7